ncbi:MBL fold metallo-hydrolase [Arthrobacter echini]|uniref:MBL fold metallo-hydrolase n=1 Tax=Arthrobacter echini TaxID=1529066 RepID=A0A5D0XQB1_9MICC|nr:MBL fold metallo-hydrolase [Arthrobacter echini]TYC98650.1 MBL fold metallo-hydrolase [Arthrobacter echini]
MSARVEHLVTSGTFSLDGGTWDVDNNVWIVGDDDECVIIDAPHDADAIVAQVVGRTVRAILLTHAHDDHIRVVRELADAVQAPIHLHEADRELWDMVFPDREPHHRISDGDSFPVAGASLTALHTPGHSPGSVCFLLEEEGTVFTGDTLFQGGPGATGRSYSDFPTIIESIRTRLLTLPPETVARPGHGDSTSIGEEAPHLEEWIQRGH